ncbi:hypothetical protein GCM10023183_24390 [Nibribacter koreensis]|uniref:CarboxypepD_reg-like domain-containing protein n=2 Tax=Nibribacter koreensis TaxID=1084519 RepID=A0ABP8FNZ8_9BACT
MTDAEVVRWLNKQKGNTCGRFTEKQLARELVAGTSGQSWTWRALALGLSAWLSTKTAEAQTKNITPTTHESLFTTIGVQPQEKNTLPAQDGTITIKGQVLDGETKEPIAGTTIQLKYSQIAVASDADGKFSLTIPKDYTSAQKVILFNFIGYVPQEKKIEDLSQLENLIIVMESDTRVLGGAEVIAWHNWYTPRGLYQRVRNLFH